MIKEPIEDKEIVFLPSSFKDKGELFISNLLTMIKNRNLRNNTSKYNEDLFINDLNNCDVMDYINLLSFMKQYNKFFINLNKRFIIPEITGKNIIDRIGVIESQDLINYMDVKQNDKNDIVTYSVIENVIIIYINTDRLYRVKNQSEQLFTVIKNNIYDYLVGTFYKRYERIGTVTKEDKRLFDKCNKAMSYFI